jgi:hypothetical protein
MVSGVATVRRVETHKSQCREAWDDEKPGIDKKMATSKRFPTLPRRADVCSRTKVGFERVSVGFGWDKTVVPL